MFWILFTIFLAACFAAGATGALFQPGDWYKALNKPRWTPPDWLFPVAWTTLYLCIATAGARAALADGNGIAMALWALQIALNTLWTPVFFGLHRIRAGMAVLCALWLAVAATMVALFQIDLIAGLLFVPYLAWVSVAAALNLAVWRLNTDIARAGTT
ncbi:tryptophan-rich sensory protein TspO [Sedimentitalea arenosa]|jgi:tryptophan-rich sensory protein|uniref:Tryptophan-rich sensory protein n=1 Tax=Sedimentitalea arenosa TaxID=2798803 RepID=A0A8J7JEU5_9RHOB|nr:TspO/MBR family protein [Arenibacterium arenosum]MBJ6370114.1 tryptophan-rich sensory protein [Arenibacterium arenosum]